MAKAKKIYYWDTCCFIAWLTSKDYPQEVLDGLDDVAKEVNENRAILCTSVMTDTEILEGQLTADQITKFQNLFKRRNVIQITLDQRIARRASEIRNYYNGRGIKIKTPDATHLATAIIYEAEEFHTLDGGGERQRPSDLFAIKWRRCWLPSSHSDAGVCSPSTFQNDKPGVQQTCLEPRITSRTKR